MSTLRRLIPRFVILRYFGPWTFDSLAGRILSENQPCLSSLADYH